MLFHPFKLHQTKDFRQCDRVGRWKLVGLTQTPSTVARCSRLQPRKSRTLVISEPLHFHWRPVMHLHPTVLIALILLTGATVPSIAEAGPNQTFTCTAKTFNECLMEAPCSAWKRSGPKEYKLDTKIIFRGNPVQGETISGGTIGDVLETKCGKK